MKQISIIILCMMYASSSADVNLDAARAHYESALTASDEQQQLGYLRETLRLIALARPVDVQEEAERYTLEIRAREQLKAMS